MLEGVLAGIISAIIFAGIVYLSKDFVWPSIQGRLQRVPNISGQWEIRNPNNKDHLIGNGKCIQRGTKVKITYLLNERVDGSPSGREFTAKGHFHSGQIVLTYEEKTNRGYIVGTAVLKLDSTGKRLTGKTAYFNHDEGQFQTDDVLVHRIIR